MSILTANIPEIYAITKHRKEQLKRMDNNNGGGRVNKGEPHHQNKRTSGGGRFFKEAFKKAVHPDSAH